MAGTPTRVWLEESSPSIWLRTAATRPVPRRRRMDLRMLPLLLSQTGAMFRSGEAAPIPVARRLHHRDGLGRSVSRHPSCDVPSAAEQPFEEVSGFGGGGGGRLAGEPVWGGRR